MTLQPIIRTYEDRSGETRISRLDSYMYHRHTGLYFKAKQEGYKKQDGTCAYCTPELHQYMRTDGGLARCICWILEEEYDLKTYQKISSPCATRNMNDFQIWGEPDSQDQLMKAMDTVMDWLGNAPYTEVTFDGYRAPSFMQTPGAKDVGVEFHSLSKIYHMTGWRIGMAVGNADLVNALSRVKSNLDSGVPQAIQYAAVEALRGSQEHIAKHNVVFQQRGEKLVTVLNEVGLKARMPKATFYVWAKIPAGYTSIDFAKKLLDEVAIAVTPGTGYGREGEGYIRFSLTISDDRLEEGVNRLSSWHGRKR